jgi:hypothetical protein
MMNRESKASGMPTRRMGGAASASGVRVSATAKKAGTLAPTIFCPSSRVEKCLREAAGTKTR